MHFLLGACVCVSGFGVFCLLRLDGMRGVCKVLVRSRSSSIASDLGTCARGLHLTLRLGIVAQRWMFGSCEVAKLWSTKLQVDPLSIFGIP